MKSDFYGKYRQADLQGLPKYAELREALRAAIADGFWKAGEQIPPEMEIARQTPFSLGTVQKALKALQAEGVLQRRQGHGTFVRRRRPEFAHPWHFRFHSRSGNAALPVYPRVLAKRIITSTAAWTKMLNPRNGRLIRIDRRINVGDKFIVYNKFFVSAEKYGRLLFRSNQELHALDFKAILHREYNVSFRQISYTMQMVRFPDSVARVLRVSRGTLGLLVELLASSERKAPVYFQQIYIPPNPCKLYITDAATMDPL
jgi:DNA-binding GntR family transcriptional regulator